MEMKMIDVFIYGKKYSVPAGLTIMEAIEYAGYKLVRGIGCRNGFCGACATVYRIKGDRELKACLACSAIPPSTIAPVAGTKGIWPDANNKPFTILP